MEGIADSSQGEQKHSRSNIHGNSAVFVRKPNSNHKETKKRNTVVDSASGNELVNSRTFRRSHFTLLLQYSSDCGFNISPRANVFVKAVEVAGK